MSPNQRASLEQETTRESFVTQLGIGGGSGGGNGSQSLGGNANGGEGWQEGVEGAWNAAKGWLGKAGSALAEGEQEIWRRVNGRS
jgi:hypothetical protein